MAKPRLYLDVDGVLNLLGVWTDRHWPDVTRARCLGFPIDYSPTMGRRIDALGVDIHWLTTWGAYDNANTWISPLFGWGSLPVVGEDLQKEAGGLIVISYGEHEDRWWKFMAIQDALAADPDHPPFIWIDDQLDDERRRDPDIDAWSATLPMKNLLVSPRSGILPSQLDEIETFLEEVMTVKTSELKAE